MERPDAYLVASKATLAMALSSSELEMVDTSTKALEIIQDKSLLGYVERIGPATIACFS